MVIKGCLTKKKTVFTGGTNELNYFFKKIPGSSKRTAVCYSSFSFLGNY